MSRNYYTSGQWNLVCDVCGKKIKSGKSRHRWDGFVVCEDDWEERQPQDFVRARVDKITVPFLRRDTGNNSYCTIIGTQAIPSWGIAGCMIPNKNTIGI